MKNKILQCSVVLASIIITSGSAAWAQNRLGTKNTQVWLNQFHTINLNKNWAVLAEYQWRRTEGLKSWQQSLLRGGLQYKFKSGVSIVAGYGWIETYPYGDYPPASPEPFPEHRIYEQLSWNDNIGRLLLNHRARLEQRFLGLMGPVDRDWEVTRWSYLNRFRYQLKATMPLNHAAMEDKTVYVSAYDEILIGFGKNVNANIFDQNRFGLLIGYKIGKSISIDGGYFNQTVQQPTPFNGKSVFQHNNGFVLNLTCNWN